MPTPLKLGPSRDLPLDVFDCIMDMLACLDDFDTLEMCSMACKDLRPLCLRFMLAKIRIADTDIQQPSLPIDQVKDLMDRNPTLSRYIQCLEVYIEPTEFDNPNFPIILDQLRNLHTLVISGIARRRYISTTHSRNPIPEPLWMSFEHLIPSTSLKNLSVSYIDNPTDSTRTAAFGPKPPIASHFERPDGLPVVDFTALENLTINAINAHHTTEHEMIVMYLYVSTNLRSLHLQVDDTFATFIVDFADYLHPLSLRTLEHLTLGFVADDACDPYFGAPMKWPSDGSRCPLHTLDLEITLLASTVFYGSAGLGQT
ncbi:hypothetical protein BJ912DRAFT_1055970 [Pholiota molesta]|nr:hypothetical protein BJ912DRAFT_1055970 [Pholiota molesta]